MREKKTRIKIRNSQHELVRINYGYEDAFAYWITELYLKLVSSALAFSNDMDLGMILAGRSFSKDMDSQINLERFLCGRMRSSLVAGSAISGEEGTGLVELLLGGVRPSWKGTLIMTEEAGAVAMGGCSRFCDS